MRPSNGWLRPTNSTESAITIDPTTTATWLIVCLYPTLKTQATAVPLVAVRA